MSDHDEMQEIPFEERYAVTNYPRTPRRVEHSEALCDGGIVRDAQQRWSDDTIERVNAEPEPVSPWAHEARRGAFIVRELLRALPAPEPAPLEQVEVCPHDGTVAHFKCDKCGEEWYTHKAGMAHSNQRFAPEVRALKAALQRIVACAKWAGAEGHGDYRDIEADAADALAGSSLPVREPAPSTLNRMEVKLEAALHARGWPNTLALIHDALELLRAARSLPVRAAPEGPWEATNFSSGRPDWNVVSADDDGDNVRRWTSVHIASQAEAFAIRDALNRVASQPERDPA